MYVLIIVVCSTRIGRDGGGGRLEGLVVRGSCGSNKGDTDSDLDLRYLKHVHDFK
jgi:hypothetical protein